MGRWEAYEAAYERLEGRSIFCLKCVAELLSPSGDDESGDVYCFRMRKLLLLPLPASDSFLLKKL